MIEEQEPVSRSDNTFDDTMRLPLVTGHSSNGHNASFPETVLSQKPGNSPYIEALIAEETAKIPASPSPSSSSLPSLSPRPLPVVLRPVARLWQFSRLLFIAIILLPIVAVSIYASVQLSQVQSGLYTVDAQSGKILWQHPISSTVQTVFLDAQGSVQIAKVNGYEQQLVALDAHGNVQWKSFASNGTFTIPSIAATPGAVLAALSQPSAIGTSLTLYSFNRTTGHMNWQYLIAQPIQTRGVDIAGTDSNYIYTISTQPLSGGRTQVQLLAINRYTGYVVWRVNSPAESNTSPLDSGNVLLSGKYLVWQVAATIQVVDVTQGTMLWHTYLPTNNILTIQQEEAQMATLRGQLIVERNDTLQAYALASGKHLWNVQAFDFSTGSTPAGIVAAGQSLLVYGNGQLAALDINTRHILWQQRELGNLLGLHVSNDGSLIYAILLDSIENSTPAQALVALDTSNGAARWTFQPYSGIDFLNPQSDGFQYHSGLILTAFCLTVTRNTCNHPRLYALNAATGNTLWQFQGNTITNALMGIDGSVITYQGKTSAWEQFTAGLRG